DGVSLEVPPGMFGLLGPNGAGKSTLMRIIVTLQRPGTGTVLVDGIDVLANPAAVRASLGYLPQDFGFHPNVPVQETLDHFAALKGFADRRERHDVVDALLHRVNLWDARSRAAGTLSGGMRQRLGVAIALCGTPRLLVLDEPTAGLDPAERHRLYDILAECGDRAMVLLSTHIVEDVNALCPAMAIIDQGRVVACGAPGDLVAGLRGRLWQRSVAAGDETTLRGAHQVIALRRQGAQQVARILAEYRPDADSVPVEPTLEDAYFARLGPRAVEG
ncbi:MAG: ATP-binding cassette domain-containing protein, partial [Gemmatimonadota bacterium]